MKTIIKLISTGARRTIDYECYNRILGEPKLYMVSKYIEIKVFGLFWVKIKRYVIYFKNRSFEIIILNSQIK